MKKYLHLLFVALFVTIFCSPQEVTAQTSSEKTITLKEIKEQMNREISRERDGEAQGHKSVILAVLAEQAEKKGMTIEDYYTLFLTEKYKFEGYTIVDEQAEKEKFASLPETMPSDLNAHLKAKGLKLYRITKNSYWYYHIDGKTTAIDISTDLEIPVDSLLPLAVIEVRDSYQTKGRLRSTEWNEEANLTKFLTHPYPTFKKATGYDGGALYFPSDRTVKISPSPKYNEGITFVSNLKTYEGSYKYAWDYNVNHNYTGKAKYTYIENWDGSRIYEGKFEFVYDLNKTTGYPYELDFVKISGQFKDNIMAGHWEFHRKSSDNIVTSITMDFDKNGLLNGEVHYPGVFDALFSHGILVYANWKEDWNGYSTEGEFYDERPIGEWVLRTNEKLLRKLGRSGERPTTTTYDRSGRFIKSGYRDDATGDWHDTHNRFPDEIPERISRIVNKYLLRDTPEYNPLKH